MVQEITPEKQSVEACLRQKSYYVDFYQREYVWETKTVEILLRDIFYAFDQSYNAHKDEELTQEVLGQYSWYYLNVFITNKENGKVYIVDGQQRLTTLTLIACKLYHMTVNENLKDSLKECIFAKDKFKGYVFCIDNEKRSRVMKCILNDISFDISTSLNKTEENLWNRYLDICKFFEKKELSPEALDTFIFYFLERLVLVELCIQKDDTPMVFEVINDRGEALKPYEILKGKMIGLLSKADTESFSQKWDISLLNVLDRQDDFFIDYLRSKFVFKSNALVESAISKAYHRYIFDNNDIADALSFRRTDKSYITNIKSFVTSELTYYTALYKKLITNNSRFLAYNRDINKFAGQNQNIMAACEVNDPDENNKIEVIAEEIDRLWVILMLNGLYDSNEYQNITFALNEQLVGKKTEEYRSVFNSLIVDTIRRKKNITDSNSVINLLDFQSFQGRNYGNLNTRFLRYFFARIEDYICTETNQKMQNDVTSVSTKTGNKTGYHIEHILSNNSESASYFRTDEEFNEKRNLLGGLLLLKGLDNISSSNELYADKLKTYESGFIWGHSLCKNFYHVNKDFQAFNERLKLKTGVQFKPYDVFDETALQERCILLFNIVKIVWDI